MDVTASYPSYRLPAYFNINTLGREIKQQTSEHYWTFDDNKSIADAETASKTKMHSLA